MMSGDGSLSRDDISPPKLDKIFRGVDLLNDALAHQAGRNEPRPVLMHSYQQLLAAIVDKTHARKIDK